MNGAFIKHYINFVVIIFIAIISVSCSSSNFKSEFVGKWEREDSSNNYSLYDTVDSIEIFKDNTCILSSLRMGSILHESGRWSVLDDGRIKIAGGVIALILLHFDQGKLIQELANNKQAVFSKPIDNKNTKVKIDSDKTYLDAMRAYDSSNYKEANKLFQNTINSGLSDDKLQMAKCMQLVSIMSEKNGKKYSIGNNKCDYLTFKLGGIPPLEWLEKEKYPIKIINMKIKNSLKNNIAVKNIMEKRLKEFGYKKPYALNLSDKYKDSITFQSASFDDKDINILMNLITQTGAFEFRLVDEENSLDKALKGDIPDDSLLMYGIDHIRNGQVPYLLKKRLLIPNPVMENMMSKADVTTGFNRSFNEEVIYIKFDDAGTKQFTNITSRNNRKRIAVTLDGWVIIAPVIQETITNGQIQITMGSRDKEEVKKIVTMLKSGKYDGQLIINAEKALKDEKWLDELKL